MKRLPVIALLLVALMLAGNLQTSYAQVPARISFQSLTFDQEGQTLSDGQYRVTFRLYDNQTGGQALWSETQSLTVQDGLLSTMIGAEKALALPFDRPYFLSVEIDGQSESQRMALSSSAYALVARDVPDSTVVRSISGLQDAIELVAGDGITIQQQGNRLIISAARGLKGYGPDETVSPAQSVVETATAVMTDEQEHAYLEELLASFGPGGSNTGLDLAYDGGRFITLDDGPIFLDASPEPATDMSGLAMQLYNGDFMMRKGDGDDIEFRFRVDGAVPQQVWRVQLEAATGTLRFVNKQGGEVAPFKMTNAATADLVTLDNSAVEIRNAAGDVVIALNADESGDGRVKTEELEITGGSDLSEHFDVWPGLDGVAPEPGMVVSIDPANPGQLTVSRAPYDRMVAGVVSGAGGIETGLLMGQKGSIADGAYPVALTGRVYVWVDAAHGAVSPGDLLTSSSTAGHAMKVTDYGRSQGAILGKAMTALPEGRGLVLMLVSLQ